MNGKICKFSLLRITIRKLKKKITMTSQKRQQEKKEKALYFSTFNGPFPVFQIRGLIFLYFVLGLQAM